MNIQSIGNLPPSSQRAADISTAANVAHAQKNDASTKLNSKHADDTNRSKPASAEQLKEAAAQANDFIKPFNGSLHFQVDQETGTTVVKVLDTETKEVIKQIPSEDMLNLAKALDQLKGLLVKQQA